VVGAGARRAGCSALELVGDYGINVSKRGFEWCQIRQNNGLSLQAFATIRTYSSASQSIAAVNSSRSLATHSSWMLGASHTKANAAGSSPMGPLSKTSTR
jgi:hypothetical protein